MMLRLRGIDGVLLSSNFLCRYWSMCESLWRFSLNLLAARVMLPPDSSNARSMSFTSNS